MRSTAGHICGAIAAAAILAACAAQQPPAPDDSFYRLEVPTPATLSAAKAPSVALRGVLEVERFAADGLTAGRPIVYSVAGDANRLMEYHYHFWTQAPTVMLQQQVADYLRGAGIADSVVTPEMRVGADHVLTAKILRLERVVGAPSAGPSTGVLRLEFGVRNEKTGRLVHHKTYGAVVAAQAETVFAAVKALNGALAQVLAALAADLKAL